jgi:hypothetical protein
VSGCVSPDWPLMRRILTLLGDDDGLADTEIAERLGRPVAEIQHAARILHRQHRTDFCAGRIVLVPSRREGRPAA